MKICMRGLLVGAAVISMCGTVVADTVATGPALVPASTTAHAAVEPLLADLRTHSTPDQYAAVAGAIHTSPALSAQLDELVGAGLLTRIAVDSGEPALGRTTGALRNGSVWILTPAFVANQAPRRLFDVVQEDDILPDNMVFALGYMAWRAKHDADVSRASGALRASDDSADAKKQRWIDLNMRIDAGGFIQGWNDTVDAATFRHDSRPISIVQAVQMMMNLRYRGPLIKAIQAAPPARKLRITGPALEPDAGNLDALVSALQSAPVIDIEPLNAAR
ncbi:MAG: hypothetical protein GAK33_05161 [Burkholderia lata]|uniref:Uncharacterized protein n=1 Tax=Burkholderia lata (strain ATCC 17760 / DSM 23089 / LMG 22485 / NCIMB 9086 / R18194 / 383) TaxID=482957 RepID=A0A833UZ98_BURL3|nr:hypothetical protein [Burkholderia lata]KAF1034938.1 MAG: hypothetical protein GAK33_05161 [Burkholderia lata]